MKILLVNTSDHKGGAAIAAMRLLEALRKNGQEATLLCRDRGTGEEGVVGLPESRRQQLRFIAERAEIFAANGFSRQNLFAIDTAAHGTDITRLPLFKEADVIHLHWINQAMLSLGDLKKIFNSGKKVVWTLHDMWPVTGICHHAQTCDRWLADCGNCRLLKRPAPHDISYRIFHKKQKIYAAARNLAFVGCSRWLTDLARRSPLTAGHEVCNIPNPIDTDFYAPQPAAAAREALGLPAEGKLLLFVAFKATDPGKGIAFLREAVDIIAKENKELAATLGVVIVGKEAERAAEGFACRTYPLGYVTDKEKMRTIYQAIDVLTMPTLMDNLPNTIVEAQACGKPCVGFNVGGLPEMIANGLNGMLVPTGNAQELAQGIASVLSTKSYDALSRNARAAAVSNYSQKAVAEKYFAVYNGTDK